MLSEWVAGSSGIRSLSRYAAQTQALLVKYGHFRLTMQDFDLGRCFADMDQKSAGMVQAGCLEAKGPDNIVLWGDSLAAHLSYGLKALCGRGVVQFTGASCRPFADSVKSARCSGLRAVFWVQKDLSPRDVVVAANWAGTAESAGKELLLDAVRTMLDSLKGAGFSVVLVGQSPVFSTHSWLRQMVRADTAPQELRVLAFNPTVLNARLAQVAADGGARFYNPSAALCDSGAGMVPCMAVQGGNALFADAGHFSVFVSTLIAQDMYDKGVLRR